VVAARGSDQNVEIGPAPAVGSTFWSLQAHNVEAKLRPGEISTSWSFAPAHVAISPDSQARSTFSFLWEETSIPAAITPALDVSSLPSAPRPAGNVEPGEPGRARRR
jgi:hypothetical protein